MAAGGPAGKTRVTVSGILMARPAASATLLARAPGGSSNIAEAASRARRVTSAVVLLFTSVFSAQRSLIFILVFQPGLHQRTATLCEASASRNDCDRQPEPRLTLSERSSARRILLLAAGPSYNFHETLIFCGDPL